jgi:hypothetical protein
MLTGVEVTHVVIKPQLPKSYYNLNDSPQNPDISTNNEKKYKACEV